jgi:hypothetical protein
VQSATRRSGRAELEAQDKQAWPLQGFAALFGSREMAHESAKHVVGSGLKLRFGRSVSVADHLNSARLKGGGYKA